MPETSTYRIVTLPKPQITNQPDAKCVALAEKFRDLRLKALQVAPEAFSSTYENESQRGLDFTLDRLSNPKALQFIALRKSPDGSPSFEGDNDVNRILKHDWLGMIVLLGPQEDTGSVVSANTDPFARMTSAQKEQRMSSNQGTSASPSRLHYHLNGVFVDNEARGGGLGLALVDAALGRAEAEAAKIDASLKISISVYDKNVAARKLYQRAGFKVVEEFQSGTHRDRQVIHMEMSLAAAP